MNGLPDGWTWAFIEDVADTSLGKMLNAKRQTGSNPTPYLRNLNVRWGAFDVTDIAAMDIEPHELDRVCARAGDVVACEGGEPGRSAVWRGDPIALQKALHRVRPRVGIASGYLAYALRWLASTRQLDRHFTGTTIKHLPQEKLRAVRLPMAPSGEQERIVAAIDEAFSKLDAGEVGLRKVRQLLKRQRDAVLAAAVTGRLVPQDPSDAPMVGVLTALGVTSVAVDGVGEVPATWAWTTVAQAGSVGLGRQRHPDWHEGPSMRRYLRVANVFEDRIDTSDLKQMHFPSSVFERFRLVPGDVLLNEGQSPELVGRPAIYQGEPPDVAFTNSLIRFRAHEWVTPQWALLVFRHYMRSGRFTREARITTNIAHLSASRLKTIEFPVPPGDEQARIVKEVERQMSSIEACERAVDVGLARSATLRRSVLKAAFEGRLVPQDPADEPASAVLDRIRAEREAAPKRPRRRGTAAS